MRSASPRCGKATTTRFPARTKPASSFSASASPRAAIAGRCASNACACPRGNDSSSALPSSDSSSAVLGPDLAHLLGLPDEIRRPVERRDEVVRDRHRLVVLAQRRLLQVEPPLGGRVDDRALDLVQRALGERREGAHGLDLVAEELDSQRLAAGRREDVDQPAADGEVAALLDAVDPLVAGERQQLGERLEPGRLAGREPDRRRPGLGRRQRLRDRGRRGADEPARREHVERPRALADEMRRRLEPGAPVHAAARQQRDALLAEEPARSLGRVAGVGVLGQQHDERAARAARAAPPAAAAAPARRRGQAPAARPRTRPGARRRAAPRRADGARAGWFRAGP